MQLPQIIIDLALIFVVAGLTSAVLRALKQPTVLGYILAGFIVGPILSRVSSNPDLTNIRVWAEIGVIFFMFTLGLEFSFRKLMRGGIQPAFTAIIQAIFMILMGYSFGQFIGWEVIDSLFLGGALAVSSTTLIFKSLTDNKLTGRKFSDLVLSITIVEDIIAMLLMVGFGTYITQQTVSGETLLSSTWRLFLIISGLFMTGYVIIPKIFKKLKPYLDAEMLTITATGLCFLMVVYVSSLGYSAALGAFVMGSILAETKYSERIEVLVRPLRDLFGAVFFVTVGMLADTSFIAHNIHIVALLSVFLIIGKLGSILIGGLLSGYPLKTVFPAGLAMGQIGEFSFIIAGLGLAQGVIRADLYPILVAVAVVNAFSTPYLIKYSENITRSFESKIPSRVLDALNFYVSKFPSSTTDSPKKLTFPIIKFLLNGILMTLIFTTGPYIIEKFLPPEIPIWLICILLAMPFIWAMFFAIRTQNNNLRTVYAPEILCKIGTLLWVGLLLAPSTQSSLTFFLIIIMMVAVLFAFYKKLETSYSWFEGQLLQNLGNNKSETLEQKIAFLEPWDAHLSKIEIHTESPLCGKSLLEIKARENHGINVAAVQRGQHVFPAPQAHFKIFPLDKLLVVGDDDHVQAFKELAKESSAVLAEQKDTLSEYALVNFELKTGHFLVGQNLIESQIREDYKCLLVGLERAGKRQVNIPPTRVFEEGDRVWIVGRSQEISRLKQAHKTLVESEPQV
jgi:monovalent cation:H+ antiporter-2, CPA2 family